MQTSLLVSELFERNLVGKKAAHGLINVSRPGVAHVSRVCDEDPKSDKCNWNSMENPSYVLLHSYLEIRHRIDIFTLD